MRRILPPLALLTRVRNLSPSDFQEDIALPLLDPRTDQDYLTAQYRWMVNNHLRPHLMRTLEDQISGSLSLDDTAYLYDSLKVYLMLGQVGPLDRDVVRTWVQNDVARRFPGTLNADLRDQMSLHTDALLEADLWNEFPLDWSVIEAAREVLLTVPVAELLYLRIRNDPVADTLPRWRLSDHGGPETGRAFSRTSAGPTADGLAGIYTRVGFHEVVLPLALSSGELFAREAWVLLGADSFDSLWPSQENLARDLLDLYYADYIAAWEGLADDLVLVPIDSPAQAIELLDILSGPRSPLKRVLDQIAWETRLSEPPSFPPGNLTLREDAAANLGQLAVRTTRLKRLLTLQSSDISLREVPGQPVEDHFARLHDFVGSETADGTPLQDYMDRFESAFDDIYFLSLSQEGVSPIEAVRALAKVRAPVPGAPTVVQRWTQQIAGGLERSLRQGDTAELNKRWQADVLPACVAATADRYPMVRASQRDIDLDAFADLFAPGGRIDSFYNENLAGLVDRRGETWTWHDNVTLSQSALDQMQRALHIRDAFFAGSPTPKVPFTLQLLALDPQASGALLSLEGQVMDFAGNSVSPVSFSWPGPVSGVELVIEGPAGASTLAFVGDWAWMRFLESTELRRTNDPSRYRITARVEGLIAVLEIAFGGQTNPFSLDALREFACPNGF